MHTLKLCVYNTLKSCGVVFTPSNNGAQDVELLFIYKVTHPNYVLVQYTMSGGVYRVTIHDSLQVFCACKWLKKQNSPQNIQL